MSKFSRGLVAVSLAVLTSGLTPARAASGNLPLSLCSPTDNDFVDPANLTQPNPYFPLTTALNGVLVGPDGDETHGLKITLGGTLLVAGVETRIVREFEWLDINGDGRQRGSDELSVEDSFNYFAQTTSGTVCYFGEDVQLFDESGNPTGGSSGSGSWRADGVTGCTGPEANAPGIVMPASPKPGMKYQQESAPCAKDVAQVVGVGTVTLRNGTSFPNAVRTKEGSLLESGKEYKSYAPMRGLIVDDGLQLCSPGADCSNAAG